MNIAIYVGDGTSPLTRSQGAACASQHFQNASLFSVRGADILAGCLSTQNINLLIIPGGPSARVEAELTQKGLLHIKHFVENGGLFWGICGGSYLACSRTLFETAEHNIDKKRDLAFFKGTEKGPIETSCSTLFFDGFKTPIPAYMYGGGVFLAPEKDKNVRVLGRLDSGEAVVLLCTVGHGKALLMSPHLEYDPFLIDADAYISKEHINALRLSNKERHDVLEHLFCSLVEKMPLQRTK